MKAKTHKNISNVPSHLGLIPDGNRRWAKAHRLEIFNGYQYGAKKFIDFGFWAKEFGVQTLTVWALSTENMKNRSKVEIDMLYKLFIKAAKDPQLLERLVKNGVRVKIIGNTKLLPKKVKDALYSIERRSKSYTDFTINLLVGYGGKEDMIHAIKSLYNNAINGKVDQITEELVSKNIRTASIPNVDFIIRTSGEKRLSGFLPWQSDYSELYFAKKQWPDFDKKDLKRALQVFSERQRRFGK